MSIADTILLSVWRDTVGQVSCQSTQVGGIYKSVKKPLWNPQKPDLCANQSTDKYRPRLILSSPVDGMKHGGFEIVTKACRKIVGSW